MRFEARFSFSFAGHSLRVLSQSSENYNRKKKEKFQIYAAYNFRWQGHIVKIYSLFRWCWRFFSLFVWFCVVVSKFFYLYRRSAYNTKLLFFFVFGYWQQATRQFQFTSVTRVNCNVKTILKIPFSLQSSELCWRNSFLFTFPYFFYSFSIPLVKAYGFSFFFFCFVVVHIFVYET